ncbi:Ig-like domain-containing protein [Aliiruegeria lutimaris]|uniref:Ig-like domain (Group 3) n=1 Tax=Aliiruegeria lutimaris TaxID=571298 RepID=A0A1G8QIP3_9RHOB|nr:Ig-like domain-containing protein [Aliiruegeria lutimaris]SDJ04674.1 hypothetical protein SAMN04488026_101115 [Aliiruegeria lutimaris]
MNVYKYAVRDSGGVFRGETSDAANATIAVGEASEVSLNISPGNVSSYTRQGSDLVLHLSNGETITLQGYFAGTQAEDRELLLSRDGELHLVAFTDNVGDEYFAQYTAVDITGKWSSYDQMTFLDLDDVEPVIAPLVAPALGMGGLGVLGAGGAAAAFATSGGDDGKDGDGDGGSDGEDPAKTGDGEAAPEDTGGSGTPGGTGGGTASDGGSGDGGDGTGDGGGSGGDGNGSGSTPIIPTVDNPDGEYDVGGNGDGSVTITGTGEPGASLTVEIDGNTQSTTVGEDGSWSVTFESDQIATGEYETAVTITSSDARGNTTVINEVLDVDTIPPEVDLGTVEGDDVINAAEASDGVTLSGSGEAGSTLSVEFQGQTRTTTIGEDGAWSIDYAASEITPGTYESEVTITATDGAGNSSTETFSLQVDTETGAGIDSGQLGGDDVANAAEQSAGITLTGTAEAGATVEVTLVGVTKTVTAGQDGTWSASYTSSEIPQGTYETTVSVVATDAAGNSATANHVIGVDTETFVTYDAGQAGATTRRTRRRSPPGWA